MSQQLRDYQARGLDRILASYRDGARVTLAVSPTGSGKTTLFTHLVSQLEVSGQRSVILVHRRELATQAANRLREFGTEFGFIMAGEPAKPYAKVQIASVPTLVRRGAVPPASLVVADEAHLSTAKTWATVLGQYPRAKILGVTATPWRLSGRPLVGAYDACVIVASPRELREQGHLCDYVGFSYKTPDLSEVSTVGGEYNERQSAEAMRAPAIVDNIVEQWVLHASELSTVVFAVTVEHSQALCAKFRAAGVAAEHLDGKTTVDQRKAILRRVGSGETRVLCNVGVAVEGLDIPRLKCCVLARPTKSLARAIQMMGRVRRPWGGLTARIHDHAFNIKLHGLPDEDRDYTLNAKPEKPPSLTQCEECLALFHGPACPACQHENTPKPQGERVLSTVPDAEQFTFTSGDWATAAAGSPAPERNSKPIEIRWERPGRVVEGRFVRSWMEPSQFGRGQVRWYLVRGAERDYSFHGTTQLDAMMASVQIPDSLLRVTQLEDLPIGGGRYKKMFRVEVDDGT